MSQTDDIVVATGLHKSFGSRAAKVHVLRGLDLTVRRGEFLAVMGPSGCGKSTLLHVLGLMTPPDAGAVVIDGMDAARDASLQSEIRRKKIGFVFQRFNLLGVLSAADNVAVSLRVRGIRPDGGIRELFDSLGVADLMNRKPAKMSIGQQQRVAIVRAMAHRPALLLADEPTGNLDSANARNLLETFQRMNRRDAQTIIMITHSAEAAAYATRTMHMKDGLILDSNA